MITFVGDWYFGGICPECGTYAAIAPDARKGQGDGRADFGKGPFSAACRYGHKNAFTTGQIIRFQMTQDGRPADRPKAGAIPIERLNASNDD